MPLGDTIQKLENNPLEHNGTLLEKRNGPSKLAVKLAYIESYGCQMNFADSEVVASILNGEGY